MFHNKKSAKDGLQSWCVGCKAAYQRESFSVITSDKHEINRMYRQSENGKKVRKESQDRRSKIPDVAMKRRARSMLNNAVASGGIDKPSICEMNDCMCYGEIQAHHKDYRLPYVVTWLCKLHHIMVHKRMNMVSADLGDGHG